MAVLEAQGTTFTVDGDAVGGIVSFTGFDGEANDIDVTTLASAAAEFRQGIPRYGNFSLELLRDPDDVGQAQLLTNKDAQASSTFVLTFPDDTTLNVWTFTGYVKSLSLAAGVDAVGTSTCNIIISGKPTLSDSTP